MESTYTASMLEQRREEAARLQSQIRALPGNDRCAECGAPGALPVPRNCTRSCSLTRVSVDTSWVSINLGIVMCIECSGIHRNLGAHITRVRSPSLDEIPPEAQRVLLQIGNILAAKVWEARVPSSVERPTAQSLRAAKEAWCRSKYIERAFVDHVSTDSKSLSEVSMASLRQRVW
jgi:hypothetical protein